MAEIKDSGNRREFESGAVRDMQEGKGRCDLLPLDIVSRLVLDNMLGTIIEHINLFVNSGKTVYLKNAIIEFVLNVLEVPMETALLEVAIHFEDGCRKYGENNWKKGIPVNCYIDSGVRHLLKFYRGDEDERHDRAFLWNMICAIWTCMNLPELNPYKEGGKN